MIALTATAAPPVRRDIVSRLGMRNHREVIASFDRPNLRLAARRFTDESDKREAVLAYVRESTGDPATRCGLVYTTSRKDTDRHAEELGAAGVRVAGYHAGKKTTDRERVHQDFLAGEIDVVVATSAFGMGIDKPDVRFVVRAAAPDSLDSYCQQIGRAGRDGAPADIVLFYRPGDLRLQRFLTASKPPTDTLEQGAPPALGPRRRHVHRPRPPHRPHRRVRLQDPSLPEVRNMASSLAHPSPPPLPALMIPPIRCAPTATTPDRGHRRERIDAWWPAAATRSLHGPPGVRGEVEREQQVGVTHIPRLFDTTEQS